MLDEKRLQSLLSQKKSKIIDEYKKLQEYRSELREAYTNLLPGFQPEQILKLLKRDGGAVPLEPFKPLLPLGHLFKDAMEMKKWALEVLTNKVVLAFDGSQIYVSSEFNVPMGFVQAGAFWIEYGVDESHYGKDSMSEIYIGSETQEKRERSEVLHQFSVDQSRVAKEIELAIKVVEERIKEGFSTYILIDTPIVQRHLIRADEKTKVEITKSIVRLLRACEKKLVPIIGYTDNSLAKDITATLEKILKKSFDIKVSDTAVVGPVVENGGFGARTPIFQLKHNLLNRYYKEYRNQICFFYQKTHSGLPVRLEFPKWIYNADMVQDVAEVVAAQAILGDGYPYVLLRAHETAVIESADRYRFYDIVTWFLKEICQVPVRETIKARRKRFSLL